MSLAGAFENLTETIDKTSYTGKDAIEGNFVSLDELANILVNFLTGVSFAIGIAGLAFGFIQYIMSSGEKERVAKAQSAVTWSVIALVVSVLAIIIKILFFSLTGVENDVY